MIVIHTAGSEKLGVGNLSRCKTLAEQLVKRKLHDIFMIYEAPINIANKFKPKEKISLFVVDTREESIKLREILSYKTKEKNKILITDIYNLSRKDEILARNQGYNCLIHLNDSGIPNYQPDIMVDQEAFVKPWLKSDKIRFLRGSKYNIMKPCITKLRPVKSWHKDKIENIMICFGGSDPGRFNEQFIHYIEYNSLEFNGSFIVIVGPGISEERWQKIKQKNIRNITYKRNPENFNDLMSKTDLLVTLGGITSYEGMCLGRPVACIKWGNLGYYIDELSKKQLVINLGDERQAFGNLFKAITEVDKLKEIGNNGWMEVDGKGAERVTQYIEKLLTGGE